MGAEKQSVRELSADDIEALAIGAWILGTGGGGDPYHKLLNVRQLYASGKTVALIDPLTLADDALIAVVSNMGAPIVGQERLADAEIAVRPLRLLEQYLGKSFDAVMALEIGGGNGLHPLMVAALTGLPVVDADTMGRAYPEAQMTSVAVANLACAPFAMADVRRNQVVIPEAESWRWLEKICRKVCTEFGSVAATCKAPRTGAEVKQHGILHTTSLAIELGQSVLAARQQHEEPVGAIVRTTGGRQLFAGKVVDVQRQTTDGFLRGEVVIENTGESASSLVIDFQNEYIVARENRHQNGRRNNQILVSTPDLICVLDSVSGDGIGTETLRFGQRVSVVALPAPSVFQTEAGLAAVGPRAFNYDFDYQPLFAATAASQ